MTRPEGLKRVQTLLVLNYLGKCDTHHSKVAGLRILVASSLHGSMFFVEDWKRKDGERISTRLMLGSNDKKSRVDWSSNRSIPHDKGMEMMMLWANTSLRWNLYIPIFTYIFIPQKKIKTRVQSSEQKCIIYSFFILEDDKAEQLRI